MAKDRGREVDDELTAVHDVMPTLKLPRMSQSELLDLKLGFLIHDVSRLRRSSFDRFMKPLGITRSQWWVVAYLSRHDGMMQTELADLLDLGKVALGGIIDRLEAAGWVERRPDTSDRRAKRIYLTPKAQKLLLDMRRVETGYTERVLNGFSSSERQTLVQLLAKMKENLKALSE
jgi:DNA-binding MarR family transcriptional regulator